MILVIGAIGLFGNFSSLLKGAAPTPTTQALTISLTNGATPGTSTWSGVLSETAGGLPVKVANQSGTVVARGGPIFLASSVTLTVTTESFYKVSVGSFNAVTFSQAQLKANGWNAPISVG